MDEYNYKISETDWKRWVKLSDDAIQRYYEKVLAEAGRFAKAPGSTTERYRKLLHFVTTADEVVATVFDEQKRTRALLQIAGALNHGMITEHDIRDFSQETRELAAQLRKEVKDL